MAKENVKKGNFFKSKKFTLTISGIIVVILVNIVGIDEAAAKEISTAILGLLAAFNIGQGIADGLSNAKTSNLSK